MQEIARTLGRNLVPQRHSRAPLMSDPTPPQGPDELTVARLKESDAQLELEWLRSISLPLWAVALSLVVSAAVTFSSGGIVPLVVFLACIAVLFIATVVLAFNLNRAHKALRRRSPFAYPGRGGAATSGHRPR